MSWNEAERKALKEDNSKQEDDKEVEMGEVKTNPCKTLIGQLLSWLYQLPVIGFNSGKYDMNVIKQLFVPYLLRRSKHDNDDDKDEYSEKLKFIDIINYLAPGFSDDKYLKAYDCELQKGHFPYEYMDGIGKLKGRAPPPQEAFYSRFSRQIRRATAVSVLRDGHRLGIHCAGWRKQRWTRQGRS